MKAAVIVFPGSNCDRDLAVALEQLCGKQVFLVWHGENSLPKTDLIAIPGGFSYGDYLRPGAMAAHSPIMEAVIRSARKGVAVLGICNGFQILTECGLLPGVLMRNRDLKFLCTATALEVSTTESIFTSEYTPNEVVTMPIAHNEGNYFVDNNTLEELESEDRIAFRYGNNTSTSVIQTSPNGSIHSIAGVLDNSRRILGMMPHPERVIDAAHTSTDGQRLFNSLLHNLT